VETQQLNSSIASYVQAKNSLGVIVPLNILRALDRAVLKISIVKPNAPTQSLYALTVLQQIVEFTRMPESLHKDIVLLSSLMALVDVHLRLIMLSHMPKGGQPRIVSLWMLMMLISSAAQRIHIKLVLSVFGTMTRLVAIKLMLVAMILILLLWRMMRHNLRVERNMTGCVVVGIVPLELMLDLVLKLGVEGLVVGHVRYWASMVLGTIYLPWPCRCGQFLLGVMLR